MLVESALLALARLDGRRAVRLVGRALRRLAAVVGGGSDPARHGLDWRTTAFGVGLTAAVTALFGVLPALRASAVAPADALTSGARVTGHRRLTHS